MKHSKHFSRVVAYTGQKNFGRLTETVKNHPWLTAAGALGALGGAYYGGDLLGSLRHVDHTALLSEPLAVYPSSHDALPVVTYGHFYVGEGEAPHLVNVPVYRTGAEVPLPETKPYTEFQATPNTLGLHPTERLTDNFFRGWKPPKGYGFNTNYPRYQWFDPPETDVVKTSDLPEGLASKGVKLMGKSYSGTPLSGIPYSGTKLSGTPYSGTTLVVPRVRIN